MILCSLPLIHLMQHQRQECLCNHSTSCVFYGHFRLYKQQREPLTLGLPKICSHLSDFFQTIGHILGRGRFISVNSKNSFLNRNNLVLDAADNHTSLNWEQTVFLFVWTYNTSVQFLRASWVCGASPQVQFILVQSPTLAQMLHLHCSISIRTACYSMMNWALAIHPEHKNSI